MAKVMNIRFKFPKLCDWIEANLPLVKAQKIKVWNAFLKHSELSNGDAFQAIRKGFGPEILIDNIYPANGKFRSDMPNAIWLADDICRWFENRASKDPAVQLLIESTILHEMCHWGDFKDGKQKRDKYGEKIEEGKAFEKEAYGRDVVRNWAGKYEEKVAAEKNNQN